MFEGSPETDTMRERSITYAQVLNELNHPANGGRFDMPIDADGADFFGVHVNPYGAPLGTWTADLLVAFQKNNQNWSEHVVAHNAGVLPEDETELASFLKTTAYDRLIQNFDRGYSEQRVVVRLQLDENVLVDLIAHGRAWQAADQAHDYDIMYTALFQRVA